MFKADLLSLVAGQSYKNVEVCEHDDIERLGINRWLGRLSSVFYADGKCIQLSYWSIALIHLNNKHIKSGEHMDRVILVGGVSYSDVTMIEDERLNDYGIPLYFTHEGQFTFSHREGTFIASPFQVITMESKSNRKTGLTRKFRYNHVVAYKSAMQTKITR